MTKDALAKGWIMSAAYAYSDPRNAAHLIVGLVNLHGTRTLNAQLVELGAGTRLGREDTVGAELGKAIKEQDQAVTNAANLLTELANDALHDLEDRELAREVENAIQARKAADQRVLSLIAKESREEPAPPFSADRIRRALRALNDRAEDFQQHCDPEEYDYSTGDIAYAAEILKSLLPKESKP